MRRTRFIAAVAVTATATMANAVAYRATLDESPAARGGGPCPVVKVAKSMSYTWATPQSWPGAWADQSGGSVAFAFDDRSPAYLDPACALTEGRYNSATWHGDPADYQPGTR